ncbi:Uma2 family endonuclease [Dyadobacter sp. BE34]|uniref:Uma2 family endonuclease n=1 Tax=Dyadobacter fermentans TaxID=94254 RepID=A0ABU1R7Y9_9BACT|nr:MULTISPECIES: Uma2 family endonuclease [Dyadobacter]MDR6809516.1 Uma2 family endonuclease [Dyadobacter fermentans]MDR7047227.1 Uma2 family endonuclease [Dyadobacter sp. BE242]MDR7201463.1 Uma2 family endonuclease [Dyadobacter sp. BE34]MDR7219333.1 Uma2 family endonuclease [Dyadobacter sp. BE31]MDR7267099.1 Uma2 family endonuclease [Dyadobacter sp. BE32]
MTVEEYFELEKQSEIRHEYYNGNIYAMAGTTLNHNRIVGKVRNLLGNHFLPRGCDVFSENVKVKVSDKYYPYPDVIVTCAPKDISGTYVVEHPSILVEVTSKHSEGNDRGLKLQQYRTISSLQYYLLVSQIEHSVDIYARVEGDNLWTWRSFENLEDIIRLEAFDFEISLKAIYENITFEPEIVQ